MLLVRENIPSKFLFVENSPTEAFFVDINLRKKEWLLSCSYNPNKENRKSPWNFEQKLDFIFI